MCAIADKPLPGGLETTGQRVYHLYYFLRLQIYSAFGFLETSLLCIMGELEGGGSVALAVGVSDR